MERTGLVLEGGGMRGVFTGGVLEFFLENKIHFPYIVGVSAGACNAASYISRQAGRNKSITVDYADHPNYISIKRFIRLGELFNMDMIFDQIPNINNPFDYNTFFESTQNFEIGVTDCHTGEAVYYEKQKLGENFNKILRASSSLPMIAPIINHEGRSYLDGGMSDPIPINESIKHDNRKHIIILTQCKGYRKTAANRGMWYFNRKYKKYPGLIKVVRNRSNVYNAALDQVNILEKEGKAFVIRPDHLQDVARVERNKGRLQALYDHGYQKAEDCFEEMMKFLDN